MRSARTRSSGGTRLAFSPETVAWLAAQSWPGNVRALENTIRYAIEACPTETIEIEHLPAHRAQNGDLPGVSTLRVARQDFERTYVREVLAAHDGNVTQAARAAGMNRRDFQRLIQRHGGAGFVPHPAGNFPHPGPKAFAPSVPRRDARDQGCGDSPAPPQGRASQERENTEAEPPAHSLLPARPDHEPKW